MLSCSVFTRTRAWLESGVPLSQLRTSLRSLQAESQRSFPVRMLTWYIFPADLVQLEKMADPGPVFFWRFVLDSQLIAQILKYFYRGTSLVTAYCVTFHIARFYVWHKKRSYWSWSTFGTGTPALSVGSKVDIYCPSFFILFLVSIKITFSRRAWKY